MKIGLFRSCASECPILNCAHIWHVVKVASGGVFASLLDNIRANKSNTNAASVNLKDRYVFHQLGESQEIKGGSDWCLALLVQSVPVFDDIPEGALGHDQGRKACVVDRSRGTGLENDFRDVGHELLRRMSMVQRVGHTGISPGD